MIPSRVSGQAGGVASATGSGKDGCGGSLNVVSTVVGSGSPSVGFQVGIEVVGVSVGKVVVGLRVGMPVSSCRTRVFVEWPLILCME